MHFAHQLVILNICVKLWAVAYRVYDLKHMWRSYVGQCVGHTFVTLNYQIIIVITEMTFPYFSCICAWFVKNKVPFSKVEFL